MRLILKSIITLFFAINIAQAEFNVPVYFVHARGHHGLSIAEAKQVIADVKDYYATYGIKLQVKGFRSIKNLYQRYYNSILNREGLLLQWRDWSRAHNLPDMMRIFITPPNDDYTLGFSFGVCNPRGTGYVSAQPRNNAGAIRFYHAEVAVAHEIGHLLGSDHVDSATLMNAAANEFTQSSILPLSDYSINQINVCLVNR